MEQIYERKHLENIQMKCEKTLERKKGDIMIPTHLNLGIGLSLNNNNVYKNSDGIFLYLEGFFVMNTNYEIYRKYIDKNETFTKGEVT